MSCYDLRIHLVYIQMVYSVGFFYVILLSNTYITSRTSLLLLRSKDTVKGLVPSPVSVSDLGPLISTLIVTNFGIILELLKRSPSTTKRLLKPKTIRPFMITSLKFSPIRKGNHNLFFVLFFISPRAGRFVFHIYHLFPRICVQS